MDASQKHVYTHFKGDSVTRTELVERKVVGIIIDSPIPDEKRSWSKTFELKHSSSVTQIGRILAQKRGLNQDLAAIICCMHDISVFVSGNPENHAHKGGEIAKKILEETGKFSEEEMKIICDAISNHSDKHVNSQDPYAELVKDADAFDCSLYDQVHDAYVYEKGPEKCKTYFARIKNVRKELGLPEDARWDSFEYIEQGRSL
ncbi:MAG: HD domain-containing protein [Candidatus Gracilibacteria bacterium]